jgi:hypothetical protein
VNQVEIHPYVTWALFRCRVTHDLVQLPAAARTIHLLKEA